MSISSSSVLREFDRAMWLLASSGADGTRTAAFSSCILRSVCSSEPGYRLARNIANRLPRLGAIGRNPGGR
jgi:hypothetical protein